MAKPKKPPTGRGAGGKRRPAAEDDQALWQAFSSSIEPFAGKERVPDSELPLIDKVLRRETTKTDRLRLDIERTVRTPERSGAAKDKRAKPALPEPGRIDAKEVRRIGSGRAAIDARIDLHGMRQAEAHGALRAFLMRSVAKGHRMVLVITGKGTMRRDDGEHSLAALHERRTEGGVLRRSVPLWLAGPDLKSVVVGYTTAQIRHGGEGALYVQLRRKT